MKKITTIIEITNAQIKVFQAEKTQEGCTVTFCDIRPLTENSDESKARLLMDMVSSLPAAFDNPTVLVPRKSVILRQMKIPSFDRREIEDIIGLQLLNNIPYSMEDVIYQFHVLEQDQDGYSRVLVIIVHKDISRSYCRILHRAGIKGGRLTIGSFGILGWLDSKNEILKEVENQPIVLLNIDTQYTEICFCHEKKLFFSRFIPYGGKSLQLEKKDELVKQIRLSFEAYYSERLGPPVEKMLILSVISEGKLLEECLEKETTIPIETVDPSKGVFYLPGVDRESLQDSWPSSITIGLGFLFSDTERLINLAPREVHEEKQKGSNRRRIVKFISLAMIAAVLGALGQLVDIYKKSMYLAELKSEMARLKPQLNEIARRDKFVKFFDRKLKNIKFIPDLINELGHLTPKEVSFRVLSLDRERRLTIRGYAAGHSDLNDFQASLIRSKQFHGVDLKFATKRKVANVSILDFEIASQLRPDKEGAL